LLAITVAASAGAPAAVAPKDWRASLGKGVISAPLYIGVDRQRTLALPGFKVRYGENVLSTP
jgi:outer membrane scaffolding protein for murein synthesis (MipA/OmpV family)